MLLSKQFGHSFTPLLFKYFIFQAQLLVSLFLRQEPYAQCPLAYNIFLREKNRS